MTKRLLEDWFSSYGQFTSKSDAAQVFHVWTAVGVLAGAAQRKIFMRSRHYNVHSNLYLLYVSPPGTGRKTTAMNIGKGLLADISPKVNFAVESGSYEALVGAMSKISNPVHQSMTLFSSELGTLMQTNTAAMVDFLTDIFDCNPNWSRNTVAHATQVIPRPWLNIIGGTTPAWLSDNIGVVAIEGGLTARCIISYTDELLLNNPGWDEEEELDDDLRRQLVHDLSHIATLEGEFKFERGKAYPKYAEWYRDRSRFPSIPDPRTAGFYIREHVHLLKIAMALSLSYKDELMILEEDLDRAWALLNATKPLMKKALNAVGKNEWAAETAHVLAQIRAKGRLEYKQLLIANYHNLSKKKLDEVLDDLRSRGQIRLEANQMWTAMTVNED